MRYISIILALPLNEVSEHLVVSMQRTYQQL